MVIDVGIVEKGCQACSGLRHAGQGQVDACLGNFWYETRSSGTGHHGRELVVAGYGEDEGSCGALTVACLRHRSPGAFTYCLNT